jgi:hypothetical protein
MVLFVLNILTRPPLFRSWRASTLMCQCSRCSWLWAYFTLLPFMYIAEKYAVLNKTACSEWTVLHIERATSHKCSCMYICHVLGSVRTWTSRIEDSEVWWESKIKTKIYVLLYFTCVNFPPPPPFLNCFCNVTISWLLCSSVLLTTIDQIMFLCLFWPVKVSCLLSVI